MIRHLGYATATRSVVSEGGRPGRPGDASPERIRALIFENLKDLARVLRFNAEHGIALYRIASEIIPFGGHPGTTVAWWDEFSSELEQIGQFARRYGLRVEMHPGRRCLLNAISPETVALSILELGWHVKLLDGLQVDASNKLVVRIGGKFGDQTASIDRFVTAINGLPDAWKRRLVVENDDVGYGVREALEASERTGLPVVLDWPDHRVNPGVDRETPRLIGLCFETWKPADGAPIVHMSRPRDLDGASVAHADWVEPGEVETLIAQAPEGIAFDCLLEASQGDRALFDLRERLAIREQGEMPRRAILAPSTSP